MAMKTRAKKKATRVVTAHEDLARQQERSMARAVASERKTKRLMRELAKQQERNGLDLLSLAAAIANRAGYKLERVSASV